SPAAPPASAGDSPLWIVTYKGIARLDPATGAVLTFDASDGVQIGEPLDGRCRRDPATGDLWVAGLGGLVTFHPDRVVTDTLPPPLDVTRVQRFGVDLPLQADGTGLPAASFGYKDVLSVSFAVLSYAGTAGAAYRLAGLDDHWITAGGDRSVT